MKMKFGLLMVFIFTQISVLAYEVNTHQAITHCALGRSDECGKEPAANLEYFSQAMNLNEVDYQNEQYEKYYTSYFDYLNKDGDFKTKNLGILGKVNYQGLIELGSILEDSVYYNPLAPGDGRYNNHFYSAQFGINFTPDTNSVTRSFLDRLSHNTFNNPLVRKSTRALFADHAGDAIGTRTDNISWIFDKEVELGLGRKNDYNLHKAFEYYRGMFADPIKGFVTEEDRKTNQAKLFTSIGFIVHMLQDLHSPAHVRNGPHASGDFLEIFGRHDGGFFLQEGSLSKTNDVSISGAVRDISVRDTYTNWTYFSYQDLFHWSADWVSKNFFSEARDFITGAIIERFFIIPNFQTGEGGLPQMDQCGRRRTTIFDDRNQELSREQTATRPIPGAEKHLGTSYDKWFYITNPTVNPSVTGVDAVALKEEGWFGDCETMSAVVDGSDQGKYSNYEKGALLQTAYHTIPRAVVFTQGFINFFFRGRMEAQLSKDNDIIVIKNVSDPRLVNKPELLTFKQKIDGLTIYYIGEDITILLEKIDLTKDLPVGEKFEITGFRQTLQDSVISPDSITNENIVVLFDGQIGEDEGVDTFGINNRGLSAAFVAKPLVKKTVQKTILSTFDDGFYRKGAFINYTRNDDNNTVVDNFTELMWQDDLDAKTIQKSWVTEEHWDQSSPTYDVTNTSGDTATSYCNNLGLGGFTDWRLPTVKELLSIVDYDTILSSAGAAINKEHFRNAAASSYWSSMPSHEYTIDWRARYVSFESGHTQAADKILLSNVRCVRQIN